MEILGGDPLFVPVRVPTSAGRFDVVFGMVDHWVDERHARITIRDVGFFEDLITYGDIVDAEIDEEDRLYLHSIRRASNWNAFAAVLSGDAAKAPVLERLRAYPPAAMLAGKVADSPLGPVLAVAVAAQWASRLSDDLDAMQANGLLSAATWALIRGQREAAA